jgi:hypothetical protein
MATTHPRTNDLLSLLTHWHIHKRETSFIRRQGMRSLEVVGLTAAILIVPTIIHQGVQSLDEVYELLGRKARSPYATLSWLGIAIAVVLMLGWHIWLGRLSYRAVLETPRSPKEYEIANDEDERIIEERISWARIFGRIIIPSLLLSLGIHFAWKLGQGLVTPKELMVKNTVDMQEAIGQLYGFQ